MQHFLGKSVYEGIAIGKIAVLKKNTVQIMCRKIQDTDAEVKRVRKAVYRSKEDLSRLQQKAMQEIGQAEAAIFGVHQLILDDPDFITEIENMIRTEQVSGEYAVKAAGERMARRFEALEDELLRSRKADMEDIIQRLTGNLAEGEKQGFSLEEPSILVAEDLTPSETVSLDRSKVLAFVTVQGSANSHTAILARIMNIPALVGTKFKLSEIEEGTLAVVDGFQGQFIVSPDDDCCEAARAKLKEKKEQYQLLQELKGKENITLSGQRIDLCANISSVEDIEAALQNDADGVGLLRSEFLYLGRPDLPTQEEQYQAYRQALQRLEGKKLIVRTLDIGVDKQVDYFRLGKEENPALGYRGIRICLKEPDVFKTQLRALLRAAAHGNLSVMYPMITSIREVEQIRKLLGEVEEELKEQEISYRMPEQGIMIETPAAVMVSDELAQMVDFFSIGTNDLTQYALAIDRQNEKLDDFYDPHHPAILRMIRMVVDSGHKYGKWVGICGELGSDLSLTEQFVKMGVDELSVAPSMVLKLRQRIRMIV